MSAETKTLDVETYHHDDEGDFTDCCVCGDELYDGDECVWEPMKFGERTLVSPAHPGCGVRNGFRLRYPAG